MNFLLKNNRSLADKSLFLFSFSIAAVPIISSFALGIFIVFNILYGYKNRRESKDDNFLLYISIWGVLIIYLIAMTYSPNFSYGIKILSRSFALLLIPFVFWFRGKLEPKVCNETIKYFVIGVVFSCILSLSISTINFFETGDIKSFTYYELAETIELHPTYFSLFILAALVFLHRIRDTRLIYKFIISFICLFTLILLQSRIALLGLVIVILYSFLNTSSNLYKRLIVFGTVLIIIIGVNSKGLTNRIIEISNFEPTLENIGTFEENGINQRSWLWQQAFIQIKEQPIFGYGLGAQRNIFKLKVEKELLQQEFNNELTIAGKNLSDRNLHNQYLQFWYEGGILGLFLFLAALFILFYKFFRNKDFANLTIFLLFSIFLVTENMLARQMGIFFYAFIFSFFLSESAKSKS